MKPFLLGKKEIPGFGLRPPVRHLAASPGAAPADPGGAAPAGPSVEVVKAGEKVVRLIVTCACGERTEIECLYRDT